MSDSLLALNRAPRVGLIGPTHWHFPLYRSGLTAAGARVVGISDAQRALASSMAEEMGCEAWERVEEMLDVCRPDFVFAFGMHAAQPDIAARLIERKIPFSIEKPCGLGAAHVRAVREAAQAAGVFASVPFHYRLSAMASTFGKLVPEPSPDFLHFGMRVNGGSPMRHREGSPWLVDPSLAGGGCLMNLGHHPIDWLLQLTSGRPVEVFARASSKLLGLDIEDWAVVQISFSDGTQATIETGYTHPASETSYMDVSLMVGHRSFNALKEGNSLRVSHREPPRSELFSVNWEFKRYFADYARETLLRAEAGDAPIASLHDLERVMQVIDAAYQSIKTGQAVSLADGNCNAH